MNNQSLDRERHTNGPARHSLTHSARLLCRLIHYAVPHNSRNRCRTGAGSKRWPFATRDAHPLLHVLFSTTLLLGTTGCTRLSNTPSNRGELGSSSSCLRRIVTCKRPNPQKPVARLPDRREDLLIVAPFSHGTTVPSNPPLGTL